MHKGLRALPSEAILTPACHVGLMSMFAYRGVTSCIMSCAINLCLMVWGLYLVQHGWDLRQNGGELMQEGSATLLAGGVFLSLAALAGIVHAIMSLRTIAKTRSKQRPLVRARSADTTN